VKWQMQLLGSSLRTEEIKDGTGQWMGVFVFFFTESHNGQG